MTMRQIRIAVFVGGALLLAPETSQAQFQGDVFFAEPSVAVPEGGTAVLELLVFSGADVVGATHLDVVFTATQAEVVKVEPGAAFQFAAGLATHTVPGRTALVNLNGSSLDEPFGTVSLARVHLRPLVAAGSRIPVNIQVHTLLLQDSTSFPNATGFSGEILVVSAGSRTAAAENALSPAALWPDLGQRARGFRRPGLAVDLLDFETSGATISAVRRRVIVPDPAAAVESPIP